MKYGVEKIKTIGDYYMVVSGAPISGDNTSEPMAYLALDMLDAVKDLNVDLAIRIGIHSGEVVAGVIGTSKFSYDLWGDTVNTSSRLESTGESGKIQTSQVVFEQLNGKFAFEDRGVIQIKGKGAFHTYFLLGEL